MGSVNRPLIGLAAVAAIGAALFASPDADATPMSYLQSLNDRGLYVTDTSAALRTGLAICAALNVANGYEVAESVYLNTDVATREQAAIMVVTAVEELCSQHDHRGLVIA